jgi:hypothetical protein
MLRRAWGAMRRWEEKMEVTKTYFLEPQKVEMRWHVQK